LFPGTIEDNIRYGSDLTDEEYQQRILDPKLNMLIQQLPYEKIVIDGTNLSGGQIQRIAIARGIIKNADIFLFDESTSNLDIEGVNSLIEIIHSLLSNKICLFIEHDDTLYSTCNRTISMGLSN
jgi:ABC-type bacteriocin/lantibiotic exporter with double-glycine peptidase domain